MDPPIEDLLDKVDSKFTLVALGAARARQVNAYYNSLGEGLGRVVPPQVTSVSGKPLSIAFEEISAGKATYSGRTPTSCSTRRPQRSSWSPTRSPSSERSQGSQRRSNSSLRPKSLEEIAERDRGRSKRSKSSRCSRRSSKRSQSRTWSKRRWRPRRQPRSRCPTRVRPPARRHPMSDQPGRPRRRPRGHRRHRRLQGHRGLPPPRRRRRPRGARAHPRRHALRRPAHVLGARLRAGADEPLRRGLTHPAHRARPGGRSRAGGAGHRATSSPATRPAWPTTC